MAWKFCCYPHYPAPTNSHLSEKLKAAIRVGFFFPLPKIGLQAWSSLHMNHSFCGLIRAVTFPVFHPQSTQAATLTGGTFRMTFSHSCHLRFIFCHWPFWSSRNMLHLTQEVGQTWSTRYFRVSFSVGGARKYFHFSHFGNLNIWKCGGRKVGTCFIGMVRLFFNWLFPIYKYSVYNLTEGRIRYIHILKGVTCNWAEIFFWTL